LLRAVIRKLWYRVCEKKRCAANKGAWQGPRGEGPVFGFAPKQMPRVSLAKARQKKSRRCGIRICARLPPSIAKQSAPS
jgi:hypothetical protein